MNCMPAIGIRNAHEPIMIGKAAVGFIPSRLTMIMHGAYRPMPSVISAPSAKLMPQARISLPPVSAVASPPPGKRLSAVMIISTAATSSATPMPRWIARLGMPVTIAAPIHEPPTPQGSAAPAS